MVCRLHPWRGGRALLAPLVAALCGCSAFVSKASWPLADNLLAAILDQPDPETVRQGAPAYLLLVDGLIHGAPESEALLRAGAQLYAAYASAFVTEPERARLLAATARTYGLRALCRASRRACGIEQLPFDEFAAALARLRRADVPALHAAAAAWAGWIQANSSDFRAVADTARVRAMMERVVVLDEGWDGGSAHLYLGVLDTLLPPALGGRPEEGKAHFQRAIALSGGRNLMVKVLYARHYARLVFDREEHDRLCREVLAASPAAPGLTLINTLAQQQARQLLATADEYFGE